MVLVKIAYSRAIQDNHRIGPDSEFYAKLKKKIYKDILPCKVCLTCT